MTTPAVRQTTAAGAAGLMLRMRDRLWLSRSYWQRAGSSSRVAAFAGPRRAWVAHVAGAVAVGVALVEVGRGRTVVSGVDDGVAIGIGGAVGARDVHPDQVAPV